MEGMQLDIFSQNYEKYTINKPIRLIELFAGYGSQKLGIEFLTDKVESYKICEWAIKSIQAYKDIHFPNDNIDYSKDLSIEQVKEFLLKKGISANYNNPLNETQIKRLNDETARTIYNNIIATHNLVNISQVKGKDLEIVDTDKYCYIMSYSFPCQDLSLAGKRAGINENTRSGLLYQVERILDERERESLPQPNILLLENVPELIGKDNVKEFNKWCDKLESLGYKNYFRILNAKNYGIPQNRRRVFMISILGDYSYEFEPPFKLELKLKDFLEKEVDEKYYLSDKMIADIQNWNAYEKPLETLDKDISKTLTTRTGAYAAGMQLVAIKNATKKGYLEATDGDGIDISGRMQYHRGTVQKETIQTLTTSDDRGVVVKTMAQTLCNNLIKNNEVGEGDVIKHSYTQKILDGEKKCVEKSDGTMITLTTRVDALGVVVPYGSYYTWKDNQGNINTQCNRAANENGSALTVACAETGKVLTNLRIRKLTPKEAFRLMAVQDKVFKRVAKNQSNASLYHLAGDSICVNCIIALMSPFFNKNAKTEIEKYVGGIIDEN